MNLTRRLLATTAAITLATAGAAGLAASPAHATSNCAYFLSATYDATTNSMSGDGEMYCPNTGEVTAAYVYLQKYNPATGVWTTVVQGPEHVEHACVGTATTAWRAYNKNGNAASRTTTANCG
ncbi:hypothetical protein R8Z50_35035 [Longispora sp. K20-0274]|uniref:hypothetical protein n=1 Tax=Longispora sp. K20-0274 TaxID=3088255 RepID=UPI003999DACB